MISPVICIKCNVKMQVAKQGVCVTELFMKDSQIYRIWQADLLRCFGCGIEIITRFADKPLALSHEKDKIRELEAYLKNRKKENLLYEWREFLKKEDK